MAVPRTIQGQDYPLPLINTSCAIPSSIGLPSYGLQCSLPNFDNIFLKILKEILKDLVIP